MAQMVTESNSRSILANRFVKGPLKVVGGAAGVILSYEYGPEFYEMMTAEPTGWYVSDLLQHLLGGVIPLGVGIGSGYVATSGVADMVISEADMPGKLENEIESYSDNARLSKLEGFHVTISDEDRDYLKQRGFEVREYPPEEDIDRIHFELSTKPTHPFKFKYGKNSQRIGFAIEPEQSYESLAGIIEKNILAVKGRSSAFPAPPGQRFILYIDTEKDRPLVEIANILMARYNRQDMLEK